MRSSAVDEDSIQFSFAGQLESFLYVTHDKLFQSIKQCFASAFSERVMQYRHTNNISFIGVRPAVIVQQMIFGEISGVMFTGNPLNNDIDQTLINATYGIGEGIVSGELDSDTWIVDHFGNIVAQKIVPKKEMIAFDNKTGSGTKKCNVDHDRSQKPSLTNEQVLELKRQGDILESLFDYIPQDIEWCIQGGILYFLQSRPITTLGHINKSKPKTILDNSNIIESYPGVTSPFTFSFASMCYNTVYRQFYSSMGVSEDRIDALTSSFRTLLCYIDGRIYYNINSWHKTLQLLPGYKLNSELMDNMMGVKSPTKIDAFSSISFSDKFFIEVPRLLNGIYHILGSFIELNKTIKSFIQTFDQVTKGYMDEKFESYTNRQLLDIYENEIEPKVLNNWKAPIINDLYVMIYFGILTKLMNKLDIENNQSIQNDLLCGEGEVESTMPTMEIIRISNWIRKDKQLMDLFMSTNEDQLRATLLESSDSQYETIRKKLKKYISDYGFRCMGELKLEESSLKEDPTFLFTTLKNYIKKDEINLKEMEEKEKAIRKKAESIVFKKVSRKLKPVFLHVLNNARKAIKNREKLRFMRTKIFGIMRSMINAIGRNFSHDGLIAQPKDIFYLHFDEMIQLIEGRCISMDHIKNTITLRKEAEIKYQAEEPGERMLFFGDIYEKNFVEIQTDYNLDESDCDLGENTYKGVPCSPGEIEGIAKIVLSPKDANLDGEIMVTKRTDPGWVPLFPSVSGIVIERGSVLSHSAVVAREMGIPTIVGLRGITDKIQNNDKIYLNGTTGIVKKL
ncbi:MAG: pyruvate, water dikinase [Candidatus Magnetoglobus multicellularis str. Araruama]|uniref:Pyruvate, water dikinase n=1 Tax=Candidatus Magnetoglobus multicellularis str. Araruama TaxID=890399 RepID=A0A1V1P8T1_9BACT|nr:MAG: pyruvate, water dikinase [Candidatus Magnetoglobus multicellularis str. Araruama]